MEFLCFSACQVHDYQMDRSEKIQELVSKELEMFQTKTTRSLDHAKQAINVMPLAVPSNVCALSPYPIVIDHGKGAKLQDIDGNEYIDYHNGFGTTIFGHANPKVTKAIQDQAERGTHFGAMTEVVTPWAEHLCARFELDWIRFSNSGTEATMDAIRLSRALTGRTKVVKIEGGYHGSHEIALVSPNLALDEESGPDQKPLAKFSGLGVSPRLLEEVIPVSFNSVEQIQAALENQDVACVILEPVLFNVGTIFPEQGYLASVRALCDQYGTKLIFDETKTGATIAWGGAEELFGVKPHFKTLGKGIGGGLAVGALGDTDGSSYELIENFSVPHLGTFSGNPLTAAAGMAALEDLSPQKYIDLNQHFLYLKQKLELVIEEFDLPAYVIGAGGKGCIVWSKQRLMNYRDYQRCFDFDIGFLAWVFMVNRGIFLAPGQDEQWTHSVFHTQSEADAFADVFKEFAMLLRASDLV